MYSGWNHFDNPEFSTNVVSLIMTFTSCYFYCFDNFIYLSFICLSVVQLLLFSANTLLLCFHYTRIGQHLDIKINSANYHHPCLACLYCCFFSEETNESVDKHALQTNDTVNWLCSCINSPRHKTLTDNMVFS